MLSDLSLVQDGCRLCGEEWIFQQDNAAIHNASIRKKHLLEQKIRLDHPACSPDLNPIEKLTVLSNFLTQKCNIKCMEKKKKKNTFGRPTIYQIKNLPLYSIVLLIGLICQNKILKLSINANIHKKKKKKKKKKLKFLHTLKFNCLYALSFIYLIFIIQKL